MLTVGDLIAEPEERILGRGVAPPLRVVRREHVGHHEPQRGKTQRCGESERLGQHGRIRGHIVGRFGVVERGGESDRQSSEEGDEKRETGHSRAPRKLPRPPAEAA